MTKIETMKKLKRTKMKITESDEDKKKATKMMMRRKIKKFTQKYKYRR